MKPSVITSVLFPILVLASLSAGEAQVLPPDGLCSDRLDAAVATFEDANLEARVRSALSVGAQDDLTCGVVSGLTDLEAQSVEIESLLGIQNLTSLTSLDLWGNSITDIDALSGLTSLTELGLGANSITDIGALRGLTSLTFLSFRENSVGDVSVLSGLTVLTNLDLTHNSISDISVLSGLTEMATLRLYNNPITDISSLRGLTKLTGLHVHDLPDLSNIEPLLNNTGLGAGDRVILMRSAISCADAAALQANGVSVGSGCLLVMLKQDWPDILAFLVVTSALLVGAVFVVRRVLSRKRARV